MFTESCLRTTPRICATLEFQILDVQVREKRIQTFDIQQKGELTSNYLYHNVKNGRNELAVYVFGVTLQGCSVLVKVSGFRPFFFLELSHFYTEDIVQNCVSELRNTLKTIIQVSFHDFKRMYGWIPSETGTRTYRFARISFESNQIMFRSSWMLQEVKLRAQRSIAHVDLSELKPDISELKVSTSEKFMAYNDLKPCGWARVVKYRYELDSNRVSMAQLEVACSIENLCAVERNEIAPVVIAAVDIEVQSHDFRSFPVASNPEDHISFIGTTFWVYGETEPRCRIMQVLGDCAVPEDSEITVECYNSEMELLCGWRDMIAVHANPDIMISYNGTGFDFKYMAERYKVLKGKNRFPFLGRFLLEPSEFRIKELTSSAKGQNFIGMFPQPGRIQLDLYLYVKDNNKLDSYKLDAVAGLFLPDKRKLELRSLSWIQGLIASAERGLAKFSDEVLQETFIKMRGCSDECEIRQHVLAVRSYLSAIFGEQSSDVIRSFLEPLLDGTSDNNYVRLFRMYTAGPAERYLITKYCQVDCDLVVYLMEKLNIVANVFQMSVVCNTLCDDVCNRGQQIKTFNLIARYTSRCGYVMNVRDPGWDDSEEYEGATVLEPEIGYYTDPIVTLDFASLYPSIMRAYNLCPSSLVLDEEYQNLPGVEYERYSIGGKEWVFQQSIPGILPRILTSLVQARKDRKKEMGRYEKTSLEYKLCDSAQLALKVCCNSVYGFCGVLKHGKYSCMPVAVATTLNGRRCIERTKQFMEERYKARVIYGDTDSVMVKIPGVNTVEAAFEFGNMASREASALFKAPITLEFEKVSCPYLLIGKKTYAAMKYEDSPGRPPRMDVKGLAIVRRDTCELVRDIMRGILSFVMERKDPEGAYEFVVKNIEDLVSGGVPLEKLQITNSVKDLESYTNPQPQVTVVKKMMERNAFDIPRCGDRVPYVIIHDPKCGLISERAEHPEFVREHGLKLDIQYYLTNQIQSRVEVITNVLPVPALAQVFSNALLQLRVGKFNLQMMDALPLSESQPRVHADGPGVVFIKKKKRRKEVESMDLMSMLA